VLSKGRQSSQNTTMLRNECTHMFFYVLEYLGGGGGVSLAHLFASAVCVDIVEV
jgi:hypothetical protein